MLENIEMHHQTNPAQSPARLDGIRVICGCDKSVQTSSDVSAQLLIALTCFKKNFYCRVIMGGGYWWSINQAVDTLINRYIIEFGRLESWSKPNSRFTPLQVFVDCLNTIKNPSNIHFMDEKVISQWCHDPITNSLFLTWLRGFLFAFSTSGTAFDVRMLDSCCASEEMLIHRPRRQA